MNLSIKNTINTKGRYKKEANIKVFACLSSELKYNLSAGIANSIPNSRMAIPDQKFITPKNNGIKLTGINMMAYSNMIKAENSFFPLDEGRSLKPALL